MLVVDAARAVLIARAKDPEVRRQIAALLGRLDNDLSDQQVLAALKALRADAARSPPLMKKDRAYNISWWKLKERFLPLSKKGLSE